MKIKLYVFDFEIPARVKRIGLLIGIPAVILGVSAVAVANVPNSFADGDLLSAAKMNDNFKALDDRLTKTEVYTNPQTMEQYSTNGGVCGQSATAIDGNIGGYAAAKTLCEQACSGSQTAHMCEGKELVRWVATNGQLPAGRHWFASGSYSFYNDDTQKFTMNDCDAFKFNGGNRGGYFWENGAGVAQCNEVHKIICCD